MVDVENIIWLGKQLKFSLGFDVDTYQKFASSYLQKLFPVSYSQKNLIEVFLTIFSEKPTFDTLKTEFKIG